MPKTSRLPKSPGRARAVAKARTALKNMTKAEAATLTAAARADRDNPEWTKRDFRRAKRGRPKLANPKRHVSLRLDAHVVAAFKSGGPGWQSRINAVLARAVRRSLHLPLEGRSKRAV